MTARVSTNPQHDQAASRPGEANQPQQDACSRRGGSTFSCDSRRPRSRLPRRSPSKSLEARRAACPRTTRPTVYIAIARWARRRRSVRTCPVPSVPGLESDDRFSRHAPGAASVLPGSAVGRQTTVAGDRSRPTTSAKCNSSIEVGHEPGQDEFARFEPVGDAMVPLGRHVSPIAACDFPRCKNSPDIRRSLAHAASPPIRRTRARAAGRRPTSCRQPRNVAPASRGLTGLSVCL